jgi:hypothetical protein
MRQGGRWATIAVLFGQLQVVPAFQVQGIQIQGMGQIDDGFLVFALLQAGGAQLTQDDRTVCYQGQGGTVGDILYTLCQQNFLSYNIE